ncbi:MAG: S-methyl-5'-thioadenosine phosphorylase [Candidatus Aenigmarchaeota archaeon]|nr:S-methyl-5'-thioadenosine phosphorylase [Candidatus Aenigmarchaeota archaeon]
MIGVLGGTGFYSLLGDAEKKEIETPFGKTSSHVGIGKIHGKDVAFIARHGEKHEYPPHKIPYKANMFAFKEIGVTHIIAPAAVGSLKREIKPGDFLVPDQFVNFTRREDTFYDGPEIVHMGSTEPYCPDLRRIIIQEGVSAGYPLHPKGTVVVIQGPRFSSHAESGFFRSQNWDIINMTQYPEVMLAREKEMCYANISLVTDYDTGVKDDPDVLPVSIEDVMRILKENNEKTKKLIFNAVRKISENRSCVCAKALDDAKL